MSTETTNGSLEDLFICILNEIGTITESITELKDRVENIEHLIKNQNNHKNNKYQEYENDEYENENDEYYDDEEYNDEEYDDDEYIDEGNITMPTLHQFLSRPSPSLKRISPQHHKYLHHQHQNEQYNDDIIEDISFDRSNYYKKKKNISPINKIKIYNNNNNNHNINNNNKITLSPEEKKIQKQLFEKSHPIKNNRPFINNSNNNKNNNNNRLEKINENQILTDQELRRLSIHQAIRNDPKLRESIRTSIMHRLSLSQSLSFDDIFGPDNRNSLYFLNEQQFPHISEYYKQNNGADHDIYDHDLGFEFSYEKKNRRKTISSLTPQELKKQNEKINNIEK